MVAGHAGYEDADREDGKHVSSCGWFQLDYCHGRPLASVLIISVDYSPSGSMAKGCREMS